jgi:FkbM family methyltransferase
MTPLTLARRIIHTVRRKRLQRLPAGGGWIRVPAGFWMYLNKAKWMDETIAMGYYESPLVYLLQQVVRPGDTCVDVGANIGYITLHLARVCGPQGRVISIEPVPETYQQLVEHIRRNHAWQVLPFCLAAGNQNGTVKIYYHVHESWHSSFYYQNSQEEQLLVPMRPLDSLWNDLKSQHRLEPLSLVKIDVEGAEPMLLEGFRQTLQAHQPILWIEINPPLLKMAGQDENSVISFLKSMNYNIYIPIWQRNWLGIPSLTLQPLDRRAIPANNKYYNAVAVVPNTSGWERLRASRIRLL